MSDEQDRSAMDEDLEWSPPSGVIRVDNIAVPGTNNEVIEDMVMGHDSTMDCSDENDDSESASARPETNLVKFCTINEVLQDMDQNIQSMTRFMEREIKDRGQPSKKLAHLKSELQVLKANVLGLRADLGTGEMSLEYTERISYDERVSDIAKFPDILKDAEKHFCYERENSYLQPSTSYSNVGNAAPEPPRQQEEAIAEPPNPMQDLTRNFEVMEISIKALQLQMSKLKRNVPGSDTEIADDD